MPEGNQQSIEGQSFGAQGQVVTDPAAVTNPSATDEATTEGTDGGSNTLGI